MPRLNILANEVNGCILIGLPTMGEADKEESRVSNRTVISCAVCDEDLWETDHNFDRGFNGEPFLIVEQGEDSNGAAFYKVKRFQDNLAGSAISAGTYLHMGCAAAHYEEWLEKALLWSEGITHGANWETHPEAKDWRKK